MNQFQLLKYAFSGSGAIWQWRLRRQLLQQRLFDPIWYTEENPDVAASGLDPLVHYLCHGIHENRSPGPGFDARWYSEVYQTKIPEGVDAASHYLRVGKRSGLRMVPDVPRPVDEPQVRVLRRIKQLRTTHLFDPHWYQASHPDLKAVNVNPYVHFASYGSAERRHPGPDFDSGWYQEEYLLDADSRECEPLFHYLDFGEAAGFATKPENKHADWMRRYHSLDEEELELLKSGPAWLSEEPIFMVFYFVDEDHNRTEAFLSAVVDQGLPVQLYIVAPSAKALALSLVRTLEILGAEVIGGDDIEGRVKAAPTHAILLFARAGSRLNPQALRMLSYYIGAQRCVAYSDHEIIDVGTGERRPYLLPDFSPWLLSQISDRIGLFAVNRAAIVPLGYQFRDEWPKMLFENTLSDNTIDFVHIDQFLYAATEPSGRDDAAWSNLSLTAPKTAPVTVAIIIPTKDHYDDLKTCIDSIIDVTAYDMSYVEIVVVDNDTTDRDACDYLADLAVAGRARVLTYAQPFNYASINNFAAAQTDAELLVFLNNDIKIIRPDWLALIAAAACDPSVGAVGAKLLFPDQTIQHGGTVLGIRGVAGHAHALLHANDPGFQGFNLLSREVSAVTGACLGVASAKFRAVGGFDGDLEIAFNDVALCVELLRLGYRNICLHQALLIHFESKTRGYDPLPKGQLKFNAEAVIFNRLYRLPNGEDPFYNPNLSLERVYELAEPPRRRRPWRLSSKQPVRRRLVMLSSTFQIGHGVATVIALQAAHLIARGYQVYFVGPRNAHEIDVDGAIRVAISTPILAARFIVRHRADIVVAHTPPFFSIARYFSVTPPLILYDYGEPPDHFFPSAELRRQTRIEKEIAFSKTPFRAAISDAVAAENPERSVIVLPLGNSHLAPWSKVASGRRMTVRADHGWEDAFVILNVCRFEKEERYYKGVIEYIDVSLRAKMRVSTRVVVVLCGKGTQQDVEDLESQGVEVFANVTDDVVNDLYFAADLYVSLSKWEGFNLGIAQALAAGLPVLASKIPAHDAFGIETFVHQTDLLTRLDQMIRAGAQERHPRIIDWTERLDQFANYVDACLAESASSFSAPKSGLLPVSWTPGLGVFVKPEMADAKTEVRA